MKNLFFSLAFLLIGSIAFAINSPESNLSNFKLVSYEDNSNFKTVIKEDLVGTCYVSISAYDEDGNKLKTWVLQFDDVASAEDCDQIGAMVEEVLSSF